MCLLLSPCMITANSLLLTPKEYETSRRTKMGSSRSYHLPKVVQSTIPFRNSSIQFPGFSSWGQLNREEADENREVEMVREHRNTDFRSRQAHHRQGWFPLRSSEARRSRSAISSSPNGTLRFPLPFFSLLYEREREEGRVRSDFFWVGG